ncbi:MAG: 50S ribosomal protein L2 [Parcubacteria group bacterium SW_4_49_11]|nr:MAG: 50S ribosomal protein L2 [Parcubacteria group bacterium SW_4_49_11]
MLKYYKPYTSGKRGESAVNYRSKVNRKNPHKPLAKRLKKQAGRNNRGRITVRHHGGGEKRKYREIDFKQTKLGVPAKVESIEYDPNRSAFITLIAYRDGEKSYILAPSGLEVGSILEFKDEAPLEAGNRMCIQHVPVGTEIYNLEMKPGRGAQTIRSAGSSGQVLAVEPTHALVRLPSGEVRKVPNNVYVSIGRVSNEEHMLQNIGRAGRSRRRGLRPTVRGSAMNPVDHPHGGGEGRQPVGLKSPKTPWGKVAHGKKTRKKNKPSDRFIVSRRRRKK